ncbi:MAG TPA: helix-turn-helix transcriptional regulator [Tepidiformaceae bacterium]
MTSEAPERTSAPSWTPRQRQVLDLLARGYTNGQIGEALGISLDGAKWHVSEVMGKLGVESREAAAAYWREYRRPLTRATRWARSLAASPFLLKAGAVSVASAAIVGGALLVTAMARSGDGQQSVQAQALATNGVRDFTVEEATRLALQIGREHLQRATGAGEAGRAEIDGRAVRVEDFILRERLFTPLTNSVEFYGNATVTSGLPSDRWGFVFEIDGTVHPDVGGSLAHVRLHLVIEDGSGTVVSLGAEVGPAQMSFYSPETLRRVAAGEDLSQDAEKLASGESVPRVFATYDDDLRRITVSVYGDPNDPCLRFDDTAAPDGVGLICPARNLPGDVLYSLMGGEGVALGTAAITVASVAAVDGTGRETEVPVHPLPVEYAGRFVVFFGPVTGAGSLELRDGDGAVLETVPLARTGPPPPPDPAYIANFFVEAVGPALSDEFDVPDASRSYPFILEFPADAEGATIIAECDAGQATILERTGPLSPQDRSIIATFPDGSTRCSLRVEVDEGVAWRLYPK